MKDRNPPGHRATPSNQGMSSTCTIYSLANAIMEQLDIVGIDLNYSHVVQTLIKFCGSKAVWPHEFHNFNRTIITMDEETKQHIAVRIKTVEKVDVEEVDMENEDVLSPAYKYVLVYSLGSSLHSVFVKRTLRLQGNAYECVNSWGDNDSYPKIELKKPGNILYRIQAEWKQASEDQIVQDSSENEKKIYIKLYLTGEEYMREYANLASQTFKDKCQEIEKQVAALYPTRSGKPTCEKVEVLRIWKGSHIIGQNNIDNNILFVELYLSVAASENDATGPLKKNILNGKLGQFDVVKVFDVLEISLDPLFYSENPNICTVNGKIEKMCKIVKSLFEGKLIAEETRKSFYSKEEPEKRFKEFQEIILKSGVNVFEQFMELMTNPQIYPNSPTVPGAYPMVFPKGMFLVIKNNFNARPENEIDADEMQLLFQELGFFVREYVNLTVAEIRQVFHEQAEDNHSAYSVFGACILTQEGTSENTFRGADATMKVEEVVNIIHDSKSLRSIPKLLILHFTPVPEISQSEENRQDQSELAIPGTTGTATTYDNITGTTDWNELNSLQNVDYRELPPTSPFVFVDPGEVLELMRRFVSLQRFRKFVKDDDEDECHMDFIPSNFLVIHSTVAGSHSLQNNKSNCCSWFISAIIYNFRAHVHNEHVERILQRVKDETSHPSRKSFVTQGINEQSWVINKLKSHLFLKPPKALEAYKYKNLFETS